MSLWMPCALFHKLNHSRLTHDCHYIPNMENPSIKSWLNFHEFTYPERGPANSCICEQQSEKQSFFRLITPLYCLINSLWLCERSFQWCFCRSSCIDLLTLHSSINKVKGMIQITSARSVLPSGKFRINTSMSRCIFPLLGRRCHLCLQVATYLWHTAANVR